MAVAVRARARVCVCVCISSWFDGAVPARRFLGRLAARRSTHTPTHRGYEAFTYHLAFGCDNSGRWQYYDARAMCDVVIADAARRPNGWP